MRCPECGRLISRWFDEDVWVCHICQMVFDTFGNELDSRARRVNGNIMVLVDGCPIHDTLTDVTIDEVLKPATPEQRDGKDNS